MNYKFRFTYFNVVKISLFNLLLSILIYFSHRNIVISIAFRIRIIIFLVLFYIIIFHVINIILLIALIIYI